MANEKVSNYGVGDTNFDELMLTVDGQRYGYHALTLTEFDTSTVPQIAAGSYIEVGGSLFKFTSNESISGSPSDGDTYIYMVPTVGTASGATTDVTGYAIGSTTITLASAGTGTILVGDFVTFAGDTVKYKVTSGDADVSNGGSITIESPGLLTAIPASATGITVHAGVITPTFTNTAPTWSDTKQGWYGTGGSANYRYVAQMVKSSSNYGDKKLLKGLEIFTDYKTGELSIVSDSISGTSITSLYLSGVSSNSYGGTTYHIHNNIFQNGTGTLRYATSLNPGKYATISYDSGSPVAQTTFYIKKPILALIILDLTSGTVGAIDIYALGVYSETVLDIYSIIEEI